jgi:NhaP-type Na+/H+ and K+/H+ antiporter
LAVAALIIYQTTSALLFGLIVIVAGVAGIEATFRGRLLAFLASLLIIILIFAGVYLAVTNFRLAIAVALILAALALLLSNLLGYLRRR